MTDPRRTAIAQVLKARRRESMDCRTHWDGCAIEPSHRDCAIAYLLAALDRSDRQIAAVRGSLHAIVREMRGTDCELTWRIEDWAARLASLLPEDRPRTPDYIGSGNSEAV